MRRALGILALLAAAATLTPCAAAAAGPWTGVGLVAPPPAVSMPLFGWRPTLHDEGPQAVVPTAPRAQVRREHGWQQMGFDVGERTTGLYLQVKGRAEFDRAEVVFADGALESFDLAGIERSRGVYRLASFTGERDVMCVRLRARALSSRAEVGVRLER